MILIKRIVALFSVTCIALVWHISPIMRPFPALTGPYPVGLKTVELANTYQNERTLVIHTFYPADDSVSTMNKAVYLGNKMPYFKQMAAHHLRLPEWGVALLFRTIKMNAIVDAPINETKKHYPLLLFSHGLLGLPTDMYISILENIASHGYIVLAIDHPSFNQLTLYRNGHIISSHHMSEQFQKMSVQEQKEFQSSSIETYKIDMQFVIDQLIAHNQILESVFSYRGDLSRIAVMGHSAGGTAAIEFCREDSRCKTAIDLDGWYDHVIGEQPIGKPLLLLFGSKSIEIGAPTAEYLKRKELTREQYFEREQKVIMHKNMLCSDAQCRMVIIPNASHGDFSDEILFKWPLRSWNAGDAYSILHSIHENILQFLERTFQDT